MADKELAIEKQRKVEQLQESVLKLLHFYLDSEEIPPNQGFKNKDLERKMIDIGWKPGMQWCALFGEMIWTEAYLDVYGRIPEEFPKLFSANSQQTFKNFIKAGWSTSDDQPTPGCLVVWREDKKGSVAGHVDLCEVTDVYNPATKLPVRMKVIGGNVSDGVRRKTKYSDKHGSYKLLGFVHLEAL